MCVYIYIYISCAWNYTPTHVKCCLHRVGGRALLVYKLAPARDSSLHALYSVIRSCML